MAAGKASSGRLYKLIPHLHMECKFPELAINIRHTCYCILTALMAIRPESPHVICPCPHRCAMAEGGNVWCMCSNHKHSATLSASAQQCTFVRVPGPQLPSG